jgi:hypothetical protein
MCVVRPLPGRLILTLQQNLRSAEEMEEEEREAQSAKLQELIRRGGPQDLQEANRLMKIMAGYDTRNKTDWRAKAAEEVAKIQQKARILEDMLQGHKPGEPIDQGDVFEVGDPLGEYISVVLTLLRNLPMPYKVLSRRSRGCAKKSRKITRL